MEFSIEILRVYSSDTCKFGRLLSPVSTLCIRHKQATRGTQYYPKFYILVHSYMHASTVEKGIQLFSKSVKSLLKLEFIGVIGVVTF